MKATHVQYCPQANEPGGGSNPPETFEAEVVEVQEPFCLTLRYTAGSPAEMYRVANVRAAGPSAKGPIPGSYQPPAGAEFPIGYVQALGLAERPAEEQVAELHEPTRRRS